MINWIASSKLVLCDGRSMLFITLVIITDIMNTNMFKCYQSCSNSTQIQYNKEKNDKANIAWQRKNGTASDSSMNICSSR